MVVGCWRAVYASELLISKCRYRSMKGKNIELLKAEVPQVEYMVKTGAIKSGTHSVTLVPYDDCIAFIHGKPSPSLFFFVSIVTGGSHVRP